MFLALVPFLFSGCVGDLEGPNTSIISTNAFVEKSTKLWVNGSVLKIMFLNGSAEEKRLTKKYALEWTQYANLDFEFYDKGEITKPDVRIKFQADENSSYLGRSKYPGYIKFRPFQESYRVIRSIVLHEFGHLLGLSHEHQRSDSYVNFSKKNFDALCNLFFSDRKSRCKTQLKTDIDINKDVKLNSEGKALRTQFDVNSIMHYDLPERLNGEVVDWNAVNYKKLDKLSISDKTFISYLYPGRVSPSSVRELHLADERREKEEFLKMRVKGSCFIEEVPGSSCRFRLRRTDSYSFDVNLYGCMDERYVSFGIYFMHNSPLCAKSGDEFKKQYQDNEKAIKRLERKQCRINLPGVENAFGKICNFGVQIVDNNNKPLVDPRLHGCFENLTIVDEKIRKSKFCRMSDKKYAKKAKQYYDENYRFNDCRILEYGDPIARCKGGYLIVDPNNDLLHNLNYCYSKLSQARERMLGSKECKENEFRHKPSLPTPPSIKPKLAADPDEMPRFQECIVVKEFKKCQGDNPYTYTKKDGSELFNAKCHGSLKEAVRHMPMNQFCYEKL